MEKTKTYEEKRFKTEALREAVALVESIAKREEIELSVRLLEVDHDDSEWSYDNLEEFFADFRRFHGRANCTLASTKLRFVCRLRERSSSVSVEAKERADIESVFEVFEKHGAAAQLSPSPEKPPAKPVVFVGHGRSLAWRDLKDHLGDKHGYSIEAYETGARAGHAIRDILEDMVSKSTFALLVLTAEDEQADGKYRARQNVIHEAGLFQGRLGFSRAIILLEEGVEEFSNVHGVQYIGFSKGKIIETYGEVLATLRREFGGDG